LIRLLNYITTNAIWQYFFWIFIIFLFFCRRFFHIFTFYNY